MTIISEEDLIKAGCFNVPEAIAVTELAFKKELKDPLFSQIKYL